MNTDIYTKINFTPITLNHIAELDEAHVKILEDAFKQKLKDTEDFIKEQDKKEPDHTAKAESKRLEMNLGERK